MKFKLTRIAAGLHDWLFAYAARVGVVACLIEPEDMTRIQKAIKDLGDDLKTEATKVIDKSVREVTDKAKKDADELLTKYGELTAAMTTLEQKVNADKEKARDPVKNLTLGQHLVKNEQFVDWIRGGNVLQPIKVDIEMDAKAITSDPLSAGPGIAPDFRPTIIPIGLQPLTVRQLMSPGTTQGNAVTYVREHGFTNAAAPVTEGGQKPESTITLESVIRPVITIAHLMKASVQILEDLPQLQSLIDERMRYGLSLAEELQLLKGSGVGLNLEGIYTVATAFSAPVTAPAPATRIDYIRLMMLQAFLSHFPPTGIVLNPIDWCAIELTKDSIGQYIIGRPQGAIQASLWNLPVVNAQSMTANTCLVGAFRPLSQIFDKSGVALVVAAENRDDFEKNMLTFRCEERLSSAVYRPEGFIRNGNLSGI